MNTDQLSSARDEDAAPNATSGGSTSSGTTGGTSNAAGTAPSSSAGSAGNDAAGSGGTAGAGGDTGTGTGGSAGSSGDTSGTAGTAQGGTCAGTTWYRDADSDGVGAASDSRVECTQPAGYVSKAGDCNDGNSAIKPQATETCDGLDTDCDAKTSDVCVSGCFGKSYSNAGYMFCSLTRTYSQAAEACEASGMRLTRITSAAENKFVFDQLDSVDVYAWIGGNDVAQFKTWAWPDGSVFYDANTGKSLDYTNWAYGQPNTGHCVQMERNSSTGNWSSTACTDTQGYVCEAY